MDPAARPDMLAVLERLRAGTGQSPPQSHTPLVNSEMNARMIAGRIVQIISRRGLPWVKNAFLRAGL